MGGAFLCTYISDNFTFIIFFHSYFSIFNCKIRISSFWSATKPVAQHSDPISFYVRYNNIFLRVFFNEFKNPVNPTFSIKTIGYVNYATVFNFFIVCGLSAQKCVGCIASPTNLILPWQDILPPSQIS